LGAVSGNQDFHRPYQPTAPPNKGAVDNSSAVGP
jgi:hypothetical protein